MADWIAEVIADPAIELKINTKHNITLDDVREACCFGAHEDARWHNHKDYGRRMIVKGRNGDGRLLIAILRPQDRDMGIWECRTARWLTKEA